MAVRESERRPRWFVTLLGIVVLVAGGFAMGLVVGLVSQEPELVVGHLAGRSEELQWAAGAEAERPSEAGLAPRATPSVADPPEPQAAPPDVAAAPLPTRASEPAAPPARAAEPVEAAAALPPPVSAAPVSPAAGYSVQVGAFAESSSAEDVARRLSDRRFPVYVTPAAGAGDRRWRVRVGPFATRSEAVELARRLKTEEGLPTWVLAEKGR